MARLRREPDGTWSSRIYLGRDALGRKVRPYRRFPQASGRAEAQLMADEWERSLRAGGLGRGTMLADVLDAYVDMRERTGSAPSSVAEWRCWARKVRAMAPRASAVDVTARQLQDMESRMLAPRGAGGCGLSRNSVRAFHGFMRAAFRRVVAQGLRDSNPMADVEQPAREGHEAAAVDEWDMPRLVAVVRGRLDGGDPTDPDYATAVAAWLALVTGVRVGEACALRRRDLRPRDPSVHVCGSVTESGGLRRLDVTKGRRSRTVGVTRADMDQLMAVLAAQDAAMSGLGPDSPLATTDGSLMRPSTVSRRFHDMAEEAGLPPRVSFHSLRHTHATWCLANGVDIKTLSLRLGHADESTTLRAYAHAMPGRDQAAARTFEDALERNLTECQTSARR